MPDKPQNADGILPVDAQQPLADIRKAIAGLGQAVAKNTNDIRDLRSVTDDAEAASKDVSFELYTAPPPSAAQDLTAFSWRWASATTITVGVGGFAIAGVGAWETAQATVTLSASVAYVYLAQTKATRSTIVAATTLTTYPESTAGEFRFALYKFTSTDSGVSYQLARDCRMDVRLGAPA